MTTFLLAAVLFAQSQPAAQPAPKPDPNAPVTLSGCVTRDYTDAKSASTYTFLSDEGGRYRLNGKGVSQYSGMAVEITGKIDRTKVKFVGGLYPSPNIAAQAGALDPGVAAVAAMPGGSATGVGNVDIPTLNVTRLSLGKGECRR